ncbi:MAG: hypothetical protein WBY53_00125 [Acidobacteriaceae bacterium]
MKLLKHLSLVAALLSGISATPSFGQIHLTLAADNPNSAACMQEVDAFKTIASRYPRPPAWHYVIVCEENSWTTILNKLGQNDPNYQVYGRTYVDSGVTYLRGWKLTHTSFADPSPDRIVAYEEAQSYLHTADIDQADKLAQQWVRKAGRSWTGPGATQPSNALTSDKSAE